MPTDKASYRAEDYGDKIPFKDSPPKVWPDNSFTNQALTPIQEHTPTKGRDTYVGIPGDGIVGGNRATSGKSRETIIPSFKKVKGNSPTGANAPVVGGGGGGQD